MAFLLAAGIYAGGRFGKTDTARSDDSASGRTSCSRHASRRHTVSTAPSPQNAAGYSRSIHPSASSEPSGMVRPVGEPPVASAPSPRPSVAATLYANLSDADFSRMGPHEQAAVLELGAYAEEAARTLDATPQSGDSDLVREKNRISAQADDYLRMSLGYGHFNRLSSMAAANRQAQADGVPSISPSGTP